VSVRSRSNWNLKVLVFKERGKPEYPEKNLSEQGREPTTNSTHIWRRHQDSNPGHIGGRRVLSPLRHPCSARHHFMGKRLCSIRLQLSKERLICFFLLIFRQTTAQLRAIILMSFKILCVPSSPQGPHAIHYVAQVQLMSNILVAHYLCR